MAEAEKLVLRANRKMFMGVVGTGSTVTYTRMRGFTTLSESKNPVEYSRKYIDETFETTDVTGMSPSYDFTFDRMTPNAVLDDIADIIDNETLGSDAVSFDIDGNIIISLSCNISQRRGCSVG